MNEPNVKCTVIYMVAVEYDRDPDELTEAYEVRDATALALASTAHDSGHGLVSTIAVLVVNEDDAQHGIDTAAFGPGA